MGLGGSYGTTDMSNWQEFFFTPGSYYMGTGDEQNTWELHKYEQKQREI